MGKKYIKEGIATENGLLENETNKTSQFNS